MSKSVRWILLGIVLFLVLILLYGLAYLYSLTQVTVEKVEITSLDDLSMTGFTLGGNVVVRNGGIVDVSIRHIQYAVTLEATEDELANGQIPGGEIPAGSTADFPLNTKINWVPTAAFAKQLITGGNTKARIHGTVDVVDLGITRITIPFEKEVDLGEYVRQFIIEEAKQVAHAVAESVKDVWDKGADMVKSGINAIFG